MRCICAAGLECPDGPVPARITRPFGQACARAATAKNIAEQTTLSPPKRQHRVKGLLGAALKKFGRAAVATRGAGLARQLSSACVTGLQHAITDVKQGAKAVRTGAAACSASPRR